MMKPHSHPKHDAKEEKKEHPGREASEINAPGAGPETIAAKETKVSAEEYEKVCSKLKEAEEFREKFLRQAADFENAKKRLTREREEFVRYSNETLIRGILPVIDNLERAVSHSETLAEENARALKDGVSLVKKQLLEFLKTQGLERIEALGKKFDPNFHEAIGHVESNEHPDETVLEELEAGYLLKGRLLRPARVRISQSSQPAVGEPPEAEGTGPVNAEENPDTEI